MKQTLSYDTKFGVGKTAFSKINLEIGIKYKPITLPTSFPRHNKQIKQQSNING